jgi:hypothetical protein
MESWKQTTFPRKTTVTARAPETEPDRERCGVPRTTGSWPGWAPASPITSALIPEEGKSQSRAVEFLDSVADRVDSAVSRVRQA